MKKLTIFGALALFAVQAFAADALGGDGLFSTGWMPNWKRVASNGDYSTGTIGIKINDSGEYVLNFSPNGKAYYDWQLQAYYMVTLKKGYTYQIQGGGYMWNGTRGEVNIGVLDAYDDGLFAVPSLDYYTWDGYFESDEYDHCTDPTEIAKLYISGGDVYGYSTNELTPKSWTV